MTRILLTRRKKIIWGSVLVLGVLASLMAGLLQSHHLLRKHIQTESQRRMHFSLVDTDRNLVEFPIAQEQGSISSAIIYFMPDDVSHETQENFGQLMRKVNAVRRDRLQIFVASRMDVDNMHNLKRIGQYPGKILLDPSGTILMRVQEWNPMQVKRDWTSIRMDSQGKILRVVKKDQPELSWME